MCIIFNFFCTGNHGIFYQELYDQLLGLEKYLSDLGSWGILQSCVAPF